MNYHDMRSIFLAQHRFCFSFSILIPTKHFALYKRSIHSAFMQVPSFFPCVIIPSHTRLSLSRCLDHHHYLHNLHSFLSFLKFLSILELSQPSFCPLFFFFFLHVFFCINIRLLWTWLLSTQDSMYIHNLRYLYYLHIMHIQLNNKI